MNASTASVDVAVIGAGMLGCSVAAHAAEAGASVAMFDEHGVAAGASGRNSGAIEHPYDAVQLAIHERTVELLRRVGLDLPSRPLGVLLLDPDRELVATAVQVMRTEHPELDARLVDPEELAALEPVVARDRWACLVDTGFPVLPHLATDLYARRARDHGVIVEVGQRATLLWEGDRCVGVTVGGRRVIAQSVVVAAGAATSRVVDPTGSWSPIAPSWGVNLEVRLAPLPRHLLLEARLLDAQAGDREPIDHAFSLIGTDGRTATLGSTWIASEPSPESWEERLLRNGERFVPGLRSATLLERRTCARPRSVDGRPLLGRVAGAEGLLVAAGNGGRGISTGAACGELVAQAIARGSDDRIPEPLRAGRFPFVRATDGAAGEIGSTA